MPWRGLVYLALIAPLHLLLYSFVSWAAFTVPFYGVVLHLLVFSTLFALLLWWAIPALAALLSVTAAANAPPSFRSVSILAGVAWGLFPIAAIVTGLTTPNEALVLGSAALICTHIWLIRAYLRR